MQYLHFSCSIAALISSYSNSTNSVLAPSPWYLVRASRASSPRSFEMSHLGDSGRNQTVDSCMMLGAICRREGILHDHVLGMTRVPYVIHAAAIAPRNQLDHFSQRIEERKGNFLPGVADGSDCNSVLRVRELTDHAWTCRRCERETET